jgi:hypothetical protein
MTSCLIVDFVCIVSVVLEIVSSCLDLFGQNDRLVKMDTGRPK